MRPQSVTTHTCRALQYSVPDACSIALYVWARHAHLSWYKVKHLQRLCQAIRHRRCGNVIKRALYYTEKH